MDSSKRFCLFNIEKNVHKAEICLVKLPDGQEVDIKNFDPQNKEQLFEVLLQCFTAVCMNVASLQRDLEELKSKTPKV